MFKKKKEEAVYYMKSVDGGVYCVPESKIDVFLENEQRMIKESEKTGKPIPDNSKIEF